MHSRATLEALASAIADLLAAKPGDWQPDSALQNLLQSAPLDLVAGFDEHARRCRFAIQARTGLRQPLTERETFLRERTNCGVFISLSSPSGYERQRALDQITFVASPFCLGLVMYRLNDWVPEIRAAAVRALGRIRPGLSRELFAECHRFYLSSKDWGRIEDEGRRALEEIFSTPDARGDALLNIIAGRGNAAPMSLRRMLRFDDWDAHLPRIALEAAHPAVRQIALRSLFAGQHTWQRHGPKTRAIKVEFDREVLMRAGLAYRTAATRLTALRAYARSLDEWSGADDLLHRMVLDPAIGVASCAAYWIDRRGGSAAALIRHRILSSAPIQPASLTLLGNVGTPDDTPLLLAVAQRSKFRTRWAALSAAGRLGSREAVEVMLAAATASDDAEGKVAASALAALREQRPLDQLMQAAATPARFLSRKLFPLMRGYKPWQQLQVVLTLLEHGAQADILESHSIRITRQARHYWKPAADHARDLSERFRRLEGAVPKALDELQWLVLRN
jgi:hypothetical protein